jgi:Flp pilus assembly pilin Flp
MGEGKHGEGFCMFDLLNAAAVRLQNAWFRARDEESGQTLVEYGLIIAIIALGAVVALGFLSGKINALFSKTGSQLGSAA